MTNLIQLKQIHICILGIEKPLSAAGELEGASKPFFLESFDFWQVVLSNLKEKKKKVFENCQPAIQSSNFVGHDGHNCRPPQHLECALAVLEISCFQL